ncbi:hypothetical protein ACMZ62_09280 [Streptococcus pluranimalium]|uniref:hypothetical protein n=1 Tax=Streptococcus TaxID=1301 RepID=UPI00035D5C2B|nr:hypothetical protein [Streptococcus thoraltensis]
MALKKLRQFQVFDTEGFLKDKDIRIIADEPWVEYDGDGKIKGQLGVKAKCVIAVDNTDYGDNVDPDLNGGEQLVIKVTKPLPNYKKFASIVINNPAATVYGDYGNQLSITAESIALKTTK